VAHDMFAIAPYTTFLNCLDVCHHSISTSQYNTNAQAVSVLRHSIRKSRWIRCSRKSRAQGGPDCTTM
jgi:hypothetical protein